MVDYTYKYYVDAVGIGKVRTVEDTYDYQLGTVHIVKLRTIDKM